MIISQHALLFITWFWNMVISIMDYSISLTEWWMKGWNFDSKYGNASFLKGIMVLEDHTPWRRAYNANKWQWFSLMNYSVMTATQPWQRFIFKSHYFLGGKSIFKRFSISRLGLLLNHHIVVERLCAGVAWEQCCVMNVNNIRLASSNFYYAWETCMEVRRSLEFDGVCLCAQLKN